MEMLCLRGKDSVNGIAANHQAPDRRNGGRGVKSPIGVHEERIEGRYVQISTHQITMGWWLHVAGYITRRQLRVWFAAFEMAEKRRYTKPCRSTETKPHNTTRKPLYRIEEIQTLVGGRGSASAAAELRADVRLLARLGLVVIADHAIDFAVSVDQINVEDVSGFWEMFNQMPNRRRCVPVPRRTLRALAGGFGRGVTAVILALLIRSVFWHRETDSYRVDGRTRGSWIADLFGISRRAVTDGRAKLIELGWIIPLETSQILLNRYGNHDRINVAWKHHCPKEPAVGEGGESASPQGDFRGESASPLNQKSSLTRINTNTRRPGPEAPDHSGVLGNEDSGSREKEATAAVGGLDRAKPRRSGKGPLLQDIQAHHLERTEDLLELYRQAVEAELVADCEAGRLDFLALAQRARVRGRNPGGMLRWLLTHRKFEFITQADEDAAATRLREFQNGPCRRGAEPQASGWIPGRAGGRAGGLELSEDDRIVRACIIAGKQHRIEPFQVAEKMKDWSRQRWDQANSAYEQKEFERWQEKAVDDLDRRSGGVHETMWCG